MELLKFLSFGSWATYIKPDEISFFIGTLVVLLLTYVLKVVVLSVIDFGETSGPTRWLLCVVVRLFQSLFQLCILFALASTGSFNALMSFMIVWILYHIVVGIYYVSDDYKGVYVYKLNGFMCNYIDNHCGQFDVYLKTRKRINNINKTVYDYRKNAIVG